MCAFGCTSSLEWGLTLYFCLLSYLFDVHALFYVQCGGRQRRGGDLEGEDAQAGSQGWTRPEGRFAFIVVVFIQIHIFSGMRLCYSFSATFLASVTGVSLEDTFRPEFGGERDSTRYKHVGRSRFVAGVGT